ncbi:MAG: xanthine dehydrogenase family protein molybdopterin-binding subunit, partial [Alphaproteobacteria bacterium]
MAKTGIGAPLPRKEDARLLHGRGRYVGDIALPGTMDVAFLRSPVAHGRIRGIGRPEGHEGLIYTAGDLAGLAPIRTQSGMPGYKISDYPILAGDKTRFVGEALAACLAPTRAGAEDLCERLEVDIEDLPPIVDMLEARKPGGPLVHDEWGDNLFLETAIDGDIDAVAASAPVKISREYRMNRQCMVPMEGMAILAHWDHKDDQLVVYMSTQIPHMARTGLAECLGLDQRRIRVISPDVGGGFGYKAVLHPEEVFVAWLACQVDHPVRWIEDRREHLVIGANSRQHHYLITAYADERGRLLALDAEISVDVGAYSVWPFTACLEAAQAGGNLPGPYVLDAYRCKTWSVATNKPPFTPYRGVARPGVCFAIELTIDAIAREVGREPHEVRMENLVPAAAMPYDNITGKHMDSGDFPESLRRAVARVDLPAVRARQGAGEPDGRLIGVGFATYTEQTAHGTKVFASWGIPIVPGFEQATGRITPDGGLEIRVGVHSHGQGMETSLAQIANEILGIDIERINMVLGDTALTPYSTGTYASRSIVMAGGAVSRSCKELAGRIARIGAHLLQCDRSEIVLADGEVRGPGGSVAMAEIANAWYLRPEQLPDDVDVGGLEATVGYKPKVDSGAFTYATHAAVVALDPETGMVEILDYVVVEDCGTIVNPLIVDGQTIGGAVQGIDTALFEEMPYDEAGQPLASTFADYIMPGPVESPDIRIEHMETPS